MSPIAVSGLGLASIRSWRGPTSSCTRSSPARRSCVSACSGRRPLRPGGRRACSHSWTGGVRRSSRRERTGSRSDFVGTASIRTRRRRCSQTASPSRMLRCRPGPSSCATSPRAGAGVALDPSPLDPETPVPFEELLLPAVLVGRNMLCSRLGLAGGLLRFPIGGSVSVAAYRDLERGLLGQLSRIAGETLRSEFDGFRPFGRSLSLLLDLPDPEPGADVHYRAFVGRHLGDGWSDLLLAYPVLGRLIGTEVGLWVDATAELLGRLGADRDELVEEFGLAGIADASHRLPGFRRRPAPERPVGRDRRARGRWQARLQAEAARARGGPQRTARLVQPPRCVPAPAGDESARPGGVRLGRASRAPAERGRGGGRALLPPRGNASVPALHRPGGRLSLREPDRLRRAPGAGRRRDAALSQPATAPASRRSRPRRDGCRPPAGRLGPLHRAPARLAGRRRPAARSRQQRTRRRRPIPRIAAERAVGPGQHRCDEPSARARCRPGRPERGAGRRPHAVPRGLRSADRRGLRGGVPAAPARTGGAARRRRPFGRDARAAGSLHLPSDPRLQRPDRGELEAGALAQRHRVRDPPRAVGAGLPRQPRAAERLAGVRGGGAGAGAGGRSALHRPDRRDVPRARRPRVAPGRVHGTEPRRGARTPLASSATTTWSGSSW